MMRADRRYITQHVLIWSIHHNDNVTVAYTYLLWFDLESGDLSQSAKLGYSAWKSSLERWSVSSIGTSSASLAIPWARVCSCMNLHVHTCTDNDHVTRLHPSVKASTSCAAWSKSFFWGNPLKRLVYGSLPDGLPPMRVAWIASKMYHQMVFRSPHTGARSWLNQMARYPSVLGLQGLLSAAMIVLRWLKGVQETSRTAGYLFTGNCV